VDAKFCLIYSDCLCLGRNKNVCRKSLNRTKL